MTEVAVVGLAIMTEPIEVGYVPYTVSADYLATFGADFDSEAIDDAILEALNRIVPEGFTVHRNGKAFAFDEDAAKQADEIDWASILKRIPVDEIIAEHSR
ncbi:MAG: hypothetical protein JWP75_1020 [Frondihabitans sp.]|nr:hypothetical protein [Frondihabitans sp.]